uniref:Transposase (Putative), gypsy type n=1 Tax=Tanacetum cinerariifolium TaxID=118510 RepID=A0A6L2MNN2_TANCI|nr:transposase (putative), gypsy type [Tanacetum cinerariifolium]
MARLKGSEKRQNFSQPLQFDCYYSRINQGEVRVALQKIRRNKSLGPDQIPIEAKRYLGDARVKWLSYLFNNILSSAKMHEEQEGRVREHPLEHGFCKKYYVGFRIEGWFKPETRELEEGAKRQWLTGKEREDRIPKIVLADHENSRKQDGNGRIENVEADVWDSVQLETAVNTISYEYLLDFTLEYGIPETLHLELPGPGDRIVDFPEGKVDERIFPTVVDWRTNASKDGMPANGTYSVDDVRALDTHRTPIQKQLEMLLCMVGISRRYYLGDEVYPTFHYDDNRGGNRPVQFDSCSKSYEGEDWEPPPCPHEVPLLTLTATRVIEMDEPDVVTDSSGVPSTIKRSSLDFAREAEASGRGIAAPEMSLPEDVPTTTAPGADQDGEAIEAKPPTTRESRKRGHDGTDANAPPKSLRRDHADLRPSCSSRGEKSLAAMQLCLASNVFVSEGVPADISDLDPLAFTDAPSPHLAVSSQGVAAAGDPESENVSSPTEVGSPGSVYLPEWGVTNVARQDQRIQARESKIKNLEALLETEVGMKRAAEEKSAGLSQELERMRAQFSELQAAFKEYKQQQDQLVEQRCTKMDARLDALSIDFDEELYPHMLIAITGRRWVAKGMSEGLKHGVVHGHAQLMVESLEAYDPEAKAKFAAALQSLKDLKYPLLDQLEGLKDAPMDVIMADLYLESDTGGMPHNLYATSVPTPNSSPSLCTRSMPHSRGWLCTSCQVGRRFVSVPTVVPQGLALLLVDAATQTDLEDV